MKQDALRYFSETGMTAIALLLFFSSFAFLIFRVYFYEREETIRQMSEIPLQDEEAGHV